MKVFWARGYEKTSVDDLVKEGNWRADGEIGDLESEAHYRKLSACAYRRAGRHHAVRRRSQANATSPCDA